MRLYGIRIEASFWFWGMLCLYLLLDREGMAPVLFAAMLLHELGHLFVLWLFGERPEAILLQCGGIAIHHRSRLTPAKEAAALLAGSGMNFVCAAVSLWAGWMFSFGCHLLLGVFNLLPMESLDGGKLWRLFLRKFPVRTVDVWLMGLQIGTSAAVSLWLFWLKQSGYPLEWRAFFLPLYLIFLIFCS